MPASIKNKVALITGGGRGIGKAIAKRYYQEGARVIICGTTTEALRDAAQEIAGAKEDVMTVLCDVSDAAQVENMAKQIKAKYGKVDILVNNAAIMTRHIGRERATRPFYELLEEDWDAVMAVNVKGPWLCAKAFYPEMKAQKWGRIINIASSTFYAGAGNGLQYVTSKGAVVGLTRRLATEVGRYGITVNAISPGLTMSETVLETVPKEALMRRAETTPIPRPEEPEDLVGTAVWLASDDAAFVTAQVISVDGGMSKH